MFYNKIIGFFIKKKYKCEIDGKKFDTYDELLEHSKIIHHENNIKMQQMWKAISS